jgi:molecular chaperone GrpE
MKDEKRPAPEDIEYIAGDGKPDGAHAETSKPAPKGTLKPSSESQSQERHETAETHHDENILEAAKHLREKIKKKDAEIKGLRKELDEFKDQYLRKLADMENLRKRLEKEKNDYLQFALGDILLEFLEIQDNFERALQLPAEDGGGKTFRDGVELICRMGANLLSRKGVQPIEIKDGVFDPTLHHAVATEESDSVTEPRVAEVLKKGYTLHNRLLRPTLVKVLVPKKAS